MMNVACTHGAASAVTRINRQCVFTRPSCLNIWNSGTIGAWLGTCGPPAPGQGIRAQEPDPCNTYGHGRPDHGDRHDGDRDGDAGEVVPRANGWKVNASPYASCAGCVVQSVGGAARISSRGLTEAATIRTVGTTNGSASTISAATSANRRKRQFSRNIHLRRSCRCSSVSSRTKVSSISASVEP